MSAHSGELNTTIAKKELGLPISIEEPFYPESDGKPMAETDVHRDLMVDIILALRDFYRDMPDVYVSGNLLMYYTEGIPTDSVAPDVFIVKGVPKRKRRIYKVWEEGKPPDVVIELTSKSTRRDDILRKKELYQFLKVDEYFIFDPLGEYLQPMLQGYRLFEGRYEPIVSSEGRLRSLMLNMELVHHGETLFLIDLQTGKQLLTPLEEAEARRKAQAKWQKAEEARQKAEEAQQEMTEKWQQEVTARKKLEVELARLKKQMKK
jgi:Uma2 family endonuclease